MKTSVTREGVYYLFIVLAILAGALVREVNAMLLFASFLFAPVILARSMGRKTLKGINVQRTAPSKIFAGEPFIVGIEANNLRPAKKLSLSCWGLVVIDRIRRLRSEESAPDEKPFEPAVYFDYIPNGQTRSRSYAGCLPHRGQYRFESVRISTRFPFGFFRNWFDQPSDQEEKEFYVYPKVGKLSSRWKSRRRKANESLQRFRYRPSPQVGEFLGVRPWQHGDSKKGIHWRASAKHQSMVVRQYELHQNQDCAVILDLHYEGEWDDAKRESFELAVSFTATLVSEWMRRGDGNIFFAATNDPEQFVHAPLSFPAQDEVLQRLTFAAPSKQDSLAETLLMIPAHHQSEIIFVTINSTDIHHSPRFKEMYDDSRYRGLLKRFHIINTSDKQLDEIFSI
jgi:uncharacterized protein (DUF58 family)